MWVTERILHLCAKLSLSEGSQALSRMPDYELGAAAYHMGVALRRFSAFCFLSFLICKMCVLITTTLLVILKVK